VGAKRLAAVAATVCEAARVGSLGDRARLAAELEHALELTAGAIESPGGEDPGG
jgi:hypothetical protein